MTIEPGKSMVLPLLPLKNSVLYPRMVLPLAAGRPASVAAVDAALASEEKMIVVVAQRDASVEEPKREDLYGIGTIAVIKRMDRSNEGAPVHLLVQGVSRVWIGEIQEMQPFLKAEVRGLPEPADSGPEIEALYRNVVDRAEKMRELLQPQIEFDLRRMVSQIEDPLNLVYLLASMMSLELPKGQQLLEANTRDEALRLVLEYLVHETQVLELRQKIANQTQTELSKEQREYVLRRQLKAIQEELGEQSAEGAETKELRARLEEVDLPPEVRKEAERELARLERLPTAAPDYQLTRTYIELVLELPWRKMTEDSLDLARARQILDEDHYDLKEVKERILEQLAVRKLNPEAKAPILCFVGPPGVGKTSLGQSIARSLGRKFERMSLGGLHDEAELRGHRRTYIGAMPGRILQAVRRAGVRNPVVMLDEVDKLGRDFRGDPSSALLEILDPAQNFTFHDNYLNLPFDLSQVLFIATANTLDRIPQPLLDRMEVLRLAGYTHEEKAEIARRYLIPRQVKEVGLTLEQVHITDETLGHAISRYTREAGVRQLERVLGRIARKVAVKFAEGLTTPVKVAPEDLGEMLGPERFYAEQVRKDSPPGVAAGLAWTEAGGDVLYVEAVLLPRGRGLTLTGQLGEVMQESARAAQSYLWSHAHEWGISEDMMRSSGLHIHVPAGAIPKDGPSAGVTMAAAVASAYTKHPVRTDTAMTGEITLTGLVLPVGGIKEKVLAAHRAGMRRVILPAENRKDLAEIPEEVRKQIAFVFVDKIDHVLLEAVPDLADRESTFISPAAIAS